MIIRDTAQIDRLAEQIFSHQPNLISIGIDDYFQIKANSTTLNATRVEIAYLIEDDINKFADAVQEFDKNGAQQVLLQVCGTNSHLEMEQIKLKEINALQKVVKEHLGNVNIIWGLCDCKSEDDSHREINIIVGYKDFIG